MKDMLRPFDFGTFSYNLFISKVASISFLARIHVDLLAPPQKKATYGLLHDLSQIYGVIVWGTRYIFVFPIRLTRGRTLACAGAKTCRHLSEGQSAKTLPSVFPPQLSINKHCTTYLHPWAYADIFCDDDLNHISKTISFGQ